MIAARTIFLATALFAAAACSGGDDSSPPDSAAAATNGTPIPPTISESTTAGGPAPTASEISNYALDMDKMRKYAQAQTNLRLLAVKSPAEAASIGRIDIDAPAPLLIAKLENNPVAKREIEKAGLSPRDYVWTTIAWIQAGSTTAATPEGQNPANVEFVKANKGEIDRLMKAAMGQ